MSKDAPIRVMVVDDQWMIREGLASLAGLEADIDVVAVASDGHEAVELVERHSPNVVLMDIRMPGMDGIGAAEVIRTLDPSVNVLMLTTFDDQQLIERSLSVGAVGYLTKDIAAADLAQAIRSAAAGVVQLSPEVTQILLGQNRSTAAHTDQPAGRDGPADTGETGARNPASPDSGLADLTDRERQVLALVARGMSNREIGRELHLSAGTVKNHVSAILRTLGISDRTQAAVIASQHGLI